MSSFPKIIALASFVASFAWAETVPDRKGAVLKDREVMESNDRWIYNDWERGFEVAKKEKKPLLVALRCIPCLGCAGIDAAILNEPTLFPLLDKFVCVRLINANTLDLALFQVDYDLSFSAVFFSPDQTVYGRYGSRRHQKDPSDETTEGFKRTLEAVLALHAGYPANKAILAGKQATAPFKTALDVPGLAGKYNRSLDWEGKVLASCVHCHMVGDAIRENFRAQRQKIPEKWVYPWPAPETIGLAFAAYTPARVTSVVRGSISEKAGLRPGDQLVSMANQPLVSVADVSWVLHEAGENQDLPISLKRDGKEKKLNVHLPNRWRQRSDISRRVGAWPMRAMATGGLLLEDLSDDERKRRQLSVETMALLVKHAGEYGTHAAAKKAGFRKGDILVEVGNQSKRITESELIGTLLHNHEPGDKVKVTVLRDDQRMALTLPIQ